MGALLTASGMTFELWLASQSDFIENGLIVDEIAELMAVNKGTLEVEAYGAVKPMASHLYGREGLTVTEAFRLTFLHGIVLGFMLQLPHDKVKETLGFLKECVVNRWGTRTERKKQATVASDTSIKELKETLESGVVVRDKRRHIIE